MEEHKNTEPSLKSKSAAIKWLKRIGVSIVFLIFAALLLLQSSFVQTWLISSITNYVSDLTHTKVTAEKIKISPFDGVVLQNLTILDMENDTVLHVGAFNVSLRKNIFYLFNKKADLSYIGIRDVYLYIKTNVGDSKSNVAQILEKFQSEQSVDKKSQSFDLKCKEIDIGTCYVKIDNQNKGKYEILQLNAANININYMDVMCNEYDLESILMDSPYFHTHIYEYGCSIEDELGIKQNPENKSDQNSSNPFKCKLGELAIKNGYFGKSNSMIPLSMEYKSYLDYNNFYFDNINLIISDLLAEDDKIIANINGINATDNTGYSIENIKSDTLILTKTSAELLALNLKFGKSIIKDRFRLNFASLSDLSDFAHNVILNTDLKNSEIYIDDLLHFVRGLEKVPFFKKNNKETISLNGKYFGKINNLAGRDVNISLGNKLSLSGSFNARDLLDTDNAVLNIRLDRFNTSMRKLRMIVPGFNPPENFNKLGSINFTGRFDGYLENFVAYGKLRSDIGSAELDMRLDITGGQTKANYSGTLNLQNFNLGLWSDNKDIGLVNFRSIVADGRGLTLNTVKAVLDARVNSLFYKKYNYKDFIVAGKIDKNTFNGSFKIADENIDFVFDGSVEYLNEKAFLSFKSDVKKLDLMALNLSKKPLSFKAKMDIDVSGRNINDFTGDINMEGLDIFSEDTTYQLANLNIISRVTVKNTRSLTVESDLGTINMDGIYDLPNIVKSAKNILYKNYNLFTRNWKDESQNILADQKFDFNFQLHDSKNFLALTGLKNLYFTKLSLKGRLDTYKNEILITTDIPKLKYNNDSLSNLQLMVISDKKAGDILIHVDSTYALGRKFNPIDFQTKFKGDTINFSFATDKIIDSLEVFEMRGNLVPHNKGYLMQLQDNLLVLLGTRWNIHPKNRLIFGKDYLELENMMISDGSRSVDINDINNNKGLTLDVSSFNLNIINNVLNYDKMLFDGITNLSARINDVFAKDKEISAYLNTPKFTINGDPYGAIYIDVNKLMTQPLNANISIGEFLAIKGSYDEQNSLVESRIKLRQAPLKLLEYLLKAGIKNTAGFINADLAFGGPVKDLKISGDGTINNGKTTLVYTGTTYYFDKQKLKLSNTAIDLDGARITDQNGGVGTIRGGLVHKLFKDFGVNATISGNNVVGLNTTKSENVSYYGYGIGQMSAEFKGPFSKVNMKINATTGPGTKLFIPVGTTNTTVDQNFIKFIKRDSSQLVIRPQNLSVEGINIEMNLTLTPDAELSLIFNESKGDIIRGTGRGNMKIDITREGDFEIFGNYEIEQGQYLFTVALLPVAKPFVVQRGGTIKWTGDPINASLDITAKYRARTSIEPFIAEYLTLASPADQRLAGQNTEVDLQLKLGGTLFKPEIRFDLDFPNLTGDIANFALSKIRIIRNNELELNGQAMGLIVFNSFLPSNRVADAFGAAGIQSASINTLSEFLTSQLSVYITNILNSMVTENGFISGIDFDLNVRNNNFGVASSNVLPDEIAVKNTIIFKNNRLSLDIGGNYIFQNQGITINQVLPDFALEFQLTEDRKLKIRLYGKYDIDPITITGLREKYGLGVAYRTEFGSMTDFEKKVKNAAKQTIEQ